MRTTGLIYDPRYKDHDTGYGHPERPARLDAIVERLARGGLTAHLDALVPPVAARAHVEAVHGKAHADWVQRKCHGGASQLDGDTAVCTDSYDIAMLAAGGSVAAVDRVLDGTWDNAFVGCRPPGHHAEATESMGFCLFNNVAIAARHLRKDRGLERVAIVDWDVHHGNGTQHIFDRDPSVLYVSLHQWPWYPGTGSAHERGLGDGEGATLNCAMPAGSGDTPYLRAFEDQVLPALESFDPQFLLISAGFDAHADDPLAQQVVSTDGFRRMSVLLDELATSRCDGRVVSLLEGGYDLDALGDSVEAHVGVLLRGASG